VVAVVVAVGSCKVPVIVVVVVVAVAVAVALVTGFTTGRGATHLGGSCVPGRAAVPVPPGRQNLLAPLSEMLRQVL
jgi:hypothetical protein